MKELREMINKCFGTWICILLLFQEKENVFKGAGQKLVVGILNAVRLC